MDWIAGIQKAIDYIEAHLTEQIDYESAAKEAYSSSFHFQRVFGILCGYTLGIIFACGDCLLPQKNYYKPTIR